MDVYFAALKYESMKQMKAYGPLNFLSKYMGTLFNDVTEVY